MDESALKVALTSSDTSWSSLEHWLWFCAFVVVVGVALEVVAVAWEHRLERSDFLREIIHSPEEPSKLKFALELVGSVLIALGVLGELIVGIRMAKVETSMRDDTAKLVSIVGSRAEKARERADALELQMKDRHITLDQREKMLPILRSRLEGSATFGHLVECGDDCREYEREVGDVFDDAGWIVAHSPMLFDSDTPTVGFLIEFQNDSFSNRRLADIATKALAKTGYHALCKPVSPDPNIKTPILVLIGRKPPEAESSQVSEEGTGNN